MKLLTSISQYQHRRSHNSWIVSLLLATFVLLSVYGSDFFAGFTTGTATTTTNIITIAVTFNVYFY